MTGQQKVLLAVVAMILGIGLYLVVVEGEVVGVAILGMATALAAITAAVGAQAKKNGNDSDAG